MLMPQILAQFSPTHILGFYWYLSISYSEAILSKNTRTPPPLLFHLLVYFSVFPLDHEGRTVSYWPYEFWDLAHTGTQIFCWMCKQSHAWLTATNLACPSSPSFFPCVPGELSIIGLSPLTHEVRASTWLNLGQSEPSLGLSLKPSMLAEMVAVAMR